MVERGLEEGSTIYLEDKSFEVLANRPVAFDIFSSSYRSGDCHGDLVEVTSEKETYTGTVHANVVDYIHPEAVYTLHGFGREISRQTRSFHAGISDQKLMDNKLDDWDEAGGAINLCEVFVVVRPSIRNLKRRVEL